MSFTLRVPGARLFAGGVLLALAARALPQQCSKTAAATVLRGAGAALALPWLETMAPGSPADNANTLSEPPLRMVFMYMPNGVRPDYWTPKGDGENYEITPHLQPLESLKSDFLLLENLRNAKTGGRNGHWPKVPAWLSGGYVERTSGDDLDSGGRLRLAPETPFRNLYLSMLHRMGIPEKSFGDSTGTLPGLA